MQLIHQTLHLLLLLKKLIQKLVCIHRIDNALLFAFNISLLINYYFLYKKQHLDNTEKPQPEALNKKAVDVVTRVREKLTGKDFQNEEPLEVKEQVDLLIQQATCHEHLCQCYIGW